MAFRLVVTVLIRCSVCYNFLNLIKLFLDELFYVITLNYIYLDVYSKLHLKSMISKGFLFMQGRTEDRDKIVTSIWY